MINDDDAKDELPDQIENFGNAQRELARTKQKQSDGDADHEDVQDAVDSADEEEVILENALKENSLEDNTEISESKETYRDACIDVGRKQGCMDGSRINSEDLEDLEQAIVSMNDAKDKLRDQIMEKGKD